MSTVIANPLVFDITAASLAAAGEQPFFAGDDWSLRFQVRRAVTIDDVVTDEAINLTDAVIVMTVRDAAHRPVLWTRTIGVACVGASPATDQIVLDDQSAEDIEDETGTGWFEVFATSSESDLLLAAAVGLHLYEIRIRFGASAGDADGDVKVVFRGQFEIGTPLTDPMPEAA